MATCCDVKVLVIGSHGRGADNWVSLQSYAIENFLHFNGVPYDFFDIYLQTLDQATLAQYQGVVLEGYSMRWDTTEQERQLVAQNMEAGNITVLLGLIDGEFDELDNTLYAAMDVCADGQGNGVCDVQLLPGASTIYSDWPEGLIIRGGRDGRHVGMVALPLSSWGTISGTYGATRTYGLEVALGTWLRQAFGVDARVTLPVISLRMDDTQTSAAPHNQTVMDFIDANKQRIRASGYLVTDASAYQGTDSTLQHDEQLLSELGSMSLHGKDHASVGAEGEDQPYSVQYDETAAAVALLESDFPHYKPIKACPNNSWNEATLHALYDNGIYYHSADMSVTDAYRALYKSLFDAASDEDRERINARLQSQLRYYPLVSTNELGTVRLYSVDWAVVLNGTSWPPNVLPILRSHGLDWRTPLLVGMHFYLPGRGGANNDPIGWISLMNTLMYTVDADSYPWRRWVDNYDFAQNTQRFDQDLTVNRISVTGDVVTYDISTSEPIRFMTLRVAKPWHEISSVEIDGADYCYFGEDYVHLPRVDGHTVIEVTLGSCLESAPHITHIDPSAVVEDARCDDGHLNLSLSGEFAVTAQIAGPPLAFLEGETCFSPEDPEELHLDVSAHKQAHQVELSVVPSGATAQVDLIYWDAADTHRRTWSEVAFPERHGDEQGHFEGVEVDHIVGDLVPGALYVVSADSTAIDTCLADQQGAIHFRYAPVYVPRTIDVVMDSTESSVSHDPQARAGGGAFAAVVCPNPFASTTCIYYWLPKPLPVTIDVYSAEGALVFHSAAPPSSAGRHWIVWNGRTSQGTRPAPGVYICRIDAGGSRRDVKMVLVR